MRAHLVVPLACVALAFSVGCGGPSTTTVHGKITYKNQPVTSGLINFQAKGQRALGGGINSDGTYEYEIPPGDYLVRIDTPPAPPPGWKEGDPQDKMGPRQVPIKYGDFVGSGLTAKISGDSGSQQLDFDLQ
jgi:hypothetical protein